MIWIAKRPRMKPEMLGFIPSFLSDDDPRPAREQINERYQHGGGWRPFQGFIMIPDGLLYKGDPMMRLLYETVLHSTSDKPEVIRFYQHDWLAIVQRDGSYEIARLD